MRFAKGPTRLGLAMAVAAEEGARGNGKTLERDLFSTSSIILLPVPCLVTQPQGVVLSKRLSTTPLHMVVQVWSSQASFLWSPKDLALNFIA